MKHIIFFTLFFSYKLAFAADSVTPDISIVNTINEAIKLASASIMPQALMWLGGFMGLQFVVTNINIIKGDGDLATVWAKFLGILLWFAFCFFVIENGPNFIDSVGNGVLTKFAPNLPSPGSVIAATLSLCSFLLIGIAATGTSIAGIGNSSVAMVLVYVLFIVFSIGAFMAIKLIMLQLELGLIVMMAPLSFSFLGLNATKDQGIAPFKALISLIYRIVLLGIVFTAFSSVIDFTGAQLDNYNWANPFDWAAKIQLIFAMLFSFPICAFLVWKSDSIAASLASGSTSMGTGDVASAAAAGAALGAAAGAGGSAATEIGGKPMQSMSDFMKSLGSSGSVSNASSSGAGGSELKPVGTPSAKKPEMSLQQMRDHPASITNKNNNSNAEAGSASSTGNSNAASTASSKSGPSSATQAANTIDNMAANGQIKDNATAKHVSDHLKSMDSGNAQAVGEAPSKGSASDSAAGVGSGSSAGIGGANSSDQKLDKLLDVLGQPKKPTLGDKLLTANDHVAKEQAATLVSINTHHAD